MRIVKLLLPSIAAIASINLAVAQPNVAASIKPIHSLVSSVMEGVATPLLLVEAGSPHTYSCLLYTSPSPRDGLLSRMPSSA